VTPLATGGQVSEVPAGAPNTGGGATAGVEDPAMLGLGGLAVLAGAGLGAEAYRRQRKARHAA
jgi:hypothetical protein